jgi:uncharacterized protein (DUF2235 family)
MGKNIVLCLDGTWNGPNALDKRGNLTPTNVQKLFESLEGSAPLAAADQEKEILWPATAGTPIAQAAKYIHGIGDTDNALARACEGAVGLGLVARVVRGYTWLSRMYAPGDRLFIVGFSRGAYTARALAGLVVRQGLLDWQAMRLEAGSQTSYSAGLAAWQLYKTAIYQNDGNILHHLASVVSDLHDRLQLGLHPSPRLQFVDGAAITAIGVWDTVGALGIPYIVEQDRSAVRLDVFQFCDTVLNAKVGSGFHAVAVDERRVDFTPTLWDARDGVVQVLFPGAHADVGGGNPVAESGLSDGPLTWMARQLAAAGVLFEALPAGTVDAIPVQHQPWIGGDVPYETGPRRFPSGLRLSQQVLQRTAAASVLVERGPAPAAAYRPPNIVGSYVTTDWTGAAPHVQVEP